MASLSFLPKLVFVFSLLICITSLLICPFPYVDGVVDASSRYHEINVNSIFPSQDQCSSTSEATGLSSSSLKVVHRHGPCSPIKHNKLSHAQILSHDDLRSNWLQTKAAAPKSTTKSKHNKKPSPNLSASSQIPINTGASFSTGNYIVTIGFGTPKLVQSAVIDTGSDVTWIQCKPCVAVCYPQSQQLFDPIQSTTYRNISCSSPYCSALDTSGCDNSNCIYGVQYGDQSYTVGFYAQDTLTLTSSDTVPNFRFGCGEKNNGLFGTAAGLVGLGRDSMSLPSQTLSKYGGVFSYCLPASSSSTGYLTFGPPTASNVQYTPMITDSTQPTFYFLELLAISVGGQQLSISPTIFSNAGTLIDSGTVITRLPPTAYAALRSAFRKGMAKYQMSRAASILDTCYDLSKVTTVTIPTVALQFRGATMNLDFRGIIYVASSTQACLAFAANGADTDLLIIGNTQQRRFNVVYDVARKQIGFSPAAC